MLPPQFTCPITGEIMLYPVSTSSGHVYERAAIARWLCGNNTDPLTNDELESKTLTPAWSLKELIAETAKQGHEAWTFRLKDAVRKLDIETVQRLLALGVDSKFKCSLKLYGNVETRKCTLLHVAAASFADTSLFEVLIKAGIDPGETNDAGEDAVDILQNLGEYREVTLTKEFDKKTKEFRLIEKEVAQKEAASRKATELAAKLHGEWQTRRSVMVIVGTSLMENIDERRRIRESTNEMWKHKRVKFF